MSDKPRIGFIGAGLMGHGMAKHLLQKGYPVTLLGNRNRAPIDDLVGKGAAEVGSPKEVAAASEIVILVLPNSPVVEQVVLGSNGVAEGAREGMILIDCTTADPTSTARVAEALAGRGVRMVDAPLTRTPKEAEEGRLNTLVGADAETFRTIRPVLEAFCENVFHVGEMGAGHAMKLINNFLGMTIAAATAEAVTTARKAGVDLAKLREVISAGAVNSGIFQGAMKYAVDKDPAGLQFALVNARKDIAYYENLASAVGVTSPIGSGTLQAMTMATAQGYGEEFVPRLMDALGRINGLDPISQE